SRRNLEAGSLRQRREAVTQIALTKSCGRDKQSRHGGGHEEHRKGAAWCFERECSGGTESAEPGGGVWLDQLRTRVVRSAELRRRRQALAESELSTDCLRDFGKGGPGGEDASDRDRQGDGDRGQRDFPSVPRRRERAVREEDDELRNHGRQRH